SGASWAGLSAPGGTSPWLYSSSVPFQCAGTSMTHVAPSANAPVRWPPGAGPGAAAATPAGAIEAAARARAVSRRVRRAVGGMADLYGSAMPVGSLPAIPVEDVRQRFALGRLEVGADRVGDREQP